MLPCNPLHRPHTRPALCFLPADVGAPGGAAAGHPTPRDTRGALPGGGKVRPPALANMRALPDANCQLPTANCQLPCPLVRFAGVSVMGCPGGACPRACACRLFACGAGTRCGLRSGGLSKSSRPTAAAGAVGVVAAVTAGTAATAAPQRLGPSRSRANAPRQEQRRAPWGALGYRQTALRL
jgi:hypothetical protein